MSFIINPYVHISSAAPWTPADTTTEGWYDAADADTITEVANSVSQWDDKSGNNKHATQSTGSRQPTYTSVDSSANNLGSIGSAVNTGQIGLDTPSITAQNIYAIVYYKDGIDSSFDTFETILCNSSGARFGRIMGQSGSTTWNGSNAFNASTYVNASAIASNIALPMPSTIFRFRATADVTQGWCMGFNSESTDRTWIGAYSEFIFTDGEETLEIQQKFEGYLAWKWGLVASLPAGHPYKSAAPTV
jgi:hypothetical protein